MIATARLSSSKFSVKGSSAMMFDGCQSPSDVSTSSASLNSLATPTSETYDGPSYRTGWRTNNSPALSLEDLLSSGSISPLLNQDGRIRRTVRQAQDACIWLKSAGFPQYVQKFEGGEFPINVTAMQVEKDHQFLDKPSIEALVKRLNVLNRCADLLEEVLSKDDDSDDDDTMRALSERWQFQRADKKWSRKEVARHTKPEFPIDTAKKGIISSEHSSSVPLLVSELSTSPTDSSIKTYFFRGDGDHLSSQDQGDDRRSFHDAEGITVTISKPMDDTNDKEENVGRIDELERMGSFASNMLNEFDANLLRLRRQRNCDISRSLPNVFNIDVSSSADPNDISTNQTGLFSLTGSVSSILDLEKDEDDEFMSTPSSVVHSRGPSDPSVPVFNGSATWGEQSPEVSAFDGNESPFGAYHRHIARRGTMDSNDSGSFMEQVEVLADSQRKKHSWSPVPVKAKWHSFQRQHSFRHAFKPLRTMIPIEELSVGQISVLRKLCLVKLTALIELHNGKTNVSRILKNRRNKQLIPRGDRIFGVPLSKNVVRYGQALPPVILKAMDHLKRTGMETTGIFRRTAAKARVELLKELTESGPESINFSEFTSYEIADLIKLYFRELPESLIPSKLSEALLVSYECIPEAVRLQAQQAIMLLLADENREALQCLLHFLSHVASHSHTHQMDAQNLGLCLSPTLFYLATIARPSPLMRRGSLRRPHSLTQTSVPSLMAAGNKELNDHVVSSRCLAELIERNEQLFKIAADMMQQCKFSHLEFGDPVPFQELGLDKNGIGGYRMYVENCMSTLAKEQRRRYRGWVHCDLIKGIGLAYCKVDDGVPLRLWRGTVEIPAPAERVLRKLWDERFLWDGHILKGRVICALDENTEIFQYVTSSMYPLTDRDHCVLRSWQYDMCNECYVVIATSVSHPNASLLAGVRSTELAMRYLIEPAGPNTSNLSLFCRVDMRGRSAEYYNRFYGRYLASSIHLLRESFQRSLELEYIETPV